LKQGVEHAVIGSYTGEGLIFCRDGDALAHVATIQLDDNAIKGVACSRDRIFAVCATAAVSLHAISDFRCLARIPKAHDRIANGCTAVGEEDFASISRDLTLKIWRGETPSTFASPHRNSIKCIAASPSGRWIGTGSYGGSIAIFDVDALSWVQVARPTTWGISSIAPGRADGEFIASSYDGHVYTAAANRRVGIVASQAA
jgi:WD40 repeat protein